MDWPIEASLGIGRGCGTRRVRRHDSVINLLPADAAYDTDICVKRPVPPWQPADDNVSIEDLFITERKLSVLLRIRDGLGSSECAWLQVYKLTYLLCFRQSAGVSGGLFTFRRGDSVAGVGNSKHSQFQNTGDVQNTGGAFWTRCRQHFPGIIDFRSI